MLTGAIAEPMNRAAPATVAFASGMYGSSWREIGSVTATRSDALRTPLLMSIPCRWRSPSYVAKKNVRLRAIGPPSAAPNWLRLNGDLRAGGVLNAFRE